MEAIGLPCPVTKDGRVNTSRDVANISKSDEQLERLTPAEIEEWLGKDKG